LQAALVVAVLREDGERHGAGEREGKAAAGLLADVRLRGLIREHQPRRAGERGHRGDLRLLLQRHEIAGAHRPDEAARAVLEAARADGDHPAIMRDEGRAGMSAEKIAVEPEDFRCERQRARGLQLLLEAERQHVAQLCAGRRVGGRDREQFVIRRGGAKRIADRRDLRMDGRDGIPDANGLPAAGGGKAQQHEIMAGEFAFGPGGEAGAAGELDADIGAARHHVPGGDHPRGIRPDEGGAGSRAAAGAAVGNHLRDIPERGLDQLRRGRLGMACLRGKQGGQRERGADQSRGRHASPQAASARAAPSAGPRAAAAAPTAAQSAPVWRIASIRSAG
jgi:hypothetical protein